MSNHSKKQLKAKQSKPFMIEEIGNIPVRMRICCPGMKNLVDGRHVIKYSLSDSLTLYVGSSERLIHDCPYCGQRIKYLK